MNIASALPGNIRALYGERITRSRGTALGGGYGRPRRSRARARSLGRQAQVRAAVRKSRARPWLVAGIVAVIFMIGMSILASADVPTMGTGTLSRVARMLTAPPEMADGNTFLRIQNTWDMKGAFEGTLVSNPFAIVHPDGLVTFTEMATFTGAVEGKSGTFVWRSAGTGDGVNFVGHLSILSGTDDLANLRGEGTFELDGPVGTYSIFYHFDP